MRGLCAALGLFTLVASCGFDPKPKNGKLPCDNGCPSGYVCGAGNRCYHTGAAVIDSGVDSPVFGKDAATAELGGTDGAGGVDSVSPEVGKEVSMDTSVAVDVGIDLAPVDTSGMADTVSIDGMDGSAIDTPIGTGGVGGSGGAIDSGGAVGGGGVSGSGGAVVTGGTSGSGGTGGTGGSNADAAPDAPQGNTDAACVPETDQQMCTRLVKNCNAFTGTDNCGQPRSITSCGTCAAAYLVCGTFAANVCPTVCTFDQSTFDNCVFGQ
jgi:hypothetical protein